MSGEDGRLPGPPRRFLSGAPPARSRARSREAGEVTLLEIEGPEQLTQSADGRFPGGEGGRLADGGGEADDAGEGAVAEFAGAVGASTAAPIATPYQSMTGVTRRPRGRA